ncbi:chemotaxis-specific protein-glutamate methyltransferase CheB [Pseudobacteriovorax antillogorgiicola]|uniref:protein-glutamate methylesterase n=1 Tax=Pseudobacteriovorax antillogorgiicola TaxID=1513793 RepID=A0A1Y6C0K4_9BACT|nr:chemotaxis-specific protein-glutamate methyltransferase CheB [Pseudobacteriovorax antillogorgiicola]TCS52369.1 two-component system chemotaxis response regulator CheB [Pseudobacteriovorax antillogorgiicola]SMF29388.1 two-component system, chemotaxis family, response regulator CheB [Pseudobacteriovorax antillogorgiicola]
MKALVVDDSVVFRSQIKSALTSCEHFKDIDVAANGRIAINKLAKGAYDLIILDLEMPELNGIETLQEMKRLGLRSKVIVFSSLTARGADATLEALEHGACDFVTKPQNVQNFELALQHVKDQLIPKALQFTGRSTNTSTGAGVGVSTGKIAVGDTTIAPRKKIIDAPPPKWKKYTLANFIPKVCVIGSSTGGPVALKELFSTIRGPLKTPVLIAQHMPPVFTRTLAKSIEDQTGIPAKEAKHFEPIENIIYVAPGDFHLSLKISNDRIYTALDKRDKRNSVRPAVDYLFESAAEVYGKGVLGMILTGMGGDGADGCCEIKNHNGCVVIQDEKSSVVWGMPGSVYRVGAYDAVQSIEECCHSIARLIGRSQ